VFDSNELPTRATTRVPSRTAIGPEVGALKITDSEPLGLVFTLVWMRWPQNPTMNPVDSRLGRALRVAMKARNATAIAVLRTALGAIDNAEAIDISQAPQGEGERSLGGGGLVGCGGRPVGTSPRATW
jgi:hypothetical protein